MEPDAHIQMHASDGADDAPHASHLRVRAARLLLVVALIFGVWLVYRALPENDGRREAHAEQPTQLRIVRRVPDGAGIDEEPAMIESAANDVTIDANVELYSIDTVAAESDYRSEQHAKVSFREFVRARSGRRPPLSARFDASNTAALRIAPGRWWIHARYTTDALEWTWRVPVNVTGREQTIELTAENVYTRSQSY